MAWTMSEFVSEVGCFRGEIVAEFGDIESDVENPDQNQVTLYSTGETTSPRPAFRAVEAWDYAQQWADRSGRPVRLRLSGELSEGEESVRSNLGVKTFRPRVVGGDEQGVPLPTRSAFSDKSPVAFATSANEYGTWHVPYDWDEESNASARLPQAKIETGNWRPEMEGPCRRARELAGDHPPGDI